MVITCFIDTDGEHEASTDVTHADIVQGNGIKYFHTILRENYNICSL